MDLFTKNGRPLQVSGGKVYSRSWQIVGRKNDDKMFGTEGRYVGTIFGERLIHRSTRSARASSPFSAATRAGTGRANRAGSAAWGDEPDAPDSVPTVVDRIVCRSKRAFGAGSRSRFYPRLLADTVSTGLVCGGQQLLLCCRPILRCPSFRISASQHRVALRLSSQSNHESPSIESAA
jgi:hypothetical protein